MSTLKVLSVSSELYPLVKTGGLADVAGALPKALANYNVKVRTLVPGYPAICESLSQVKVLHTKELFGVPARLLSGTAKGLDLLVLDAPSLFDRPGNPYLGEDGKDWFDNPIRFAALSYVAAEIGGGLLKDYQPDVLHAHDWQTALTPVYVRYKGYPVKTVLTVHNMAYQGHFDAAVFQHLNLPSEAFHIDGVEYYGGVGYLKGGLNNADAITTVSPSYVDEICTPEGGMGLDGVLRARKHLMRGIVNGVDTAQWNPKADEALVQCYDARSLAKRMANKRAIEARMGLNVGDGPLYCVISRLVWQKGIDILLEALGTLVESGARLAVLGSGEAVLERQLLEAAERYPGKVGVVLGYDESLSHLLQGGSDAILIPSRFEPCGLTQLYGLRYGCVPLVARTGGLADTIVDANDAALAAGVATGVMYAPDSAHALRNALVRTAALYADRKLWQTMQKAGMKTDVSWERSAQQYAQLYQSLVSVEI